MPDEEVKNKMRLTYFIARSGECVLSVTGSMSQAFVDKHGAAWWLRQFADGIEKAGPTADAQPAYQLPPQATHEKQT